MFSRREAIIKAAIMEKLGQGFSVFTADDILAVANVNVHQIEQLHSILDQEVTQIVEHIPDYAPEEVTVKPTKCKPKPNGKGKQP